MGEIYDVVTDGILYETGIQSDLSQWKLWSMLVVLIANIDFGAKLFYFPMFWQVPISTHSCNWRRWVSLGSANTNNADAPSSRVWVGSPLEIQGG